MELFLFHSLTEDAVTAALLRFRETGEVSAYYQAARGLIAFAKGRKTRGNIIKEYILQQILDSENLPYILKLRDFLRQDIKTVFFELLEIDWDKLFREKGLVPLSDIPLQGKADEENAGYVRSLEMMMDCTSNEALVGALLAHAESFFPVMEEGSAE